MTHVIHISDTHFGPAADFAVRGAPVVARAEALVEAINALPFEPDLVIHTGDVAGDPDPASYDTAHKTLSKLKAPIFYTVGNHDDAEMMRQHLGIQPEHPLVSDEDRLCYELKREGVSLFILDAKVPAEEGPHGVLPGNQLEALRTRISESDQPFALFIHYPLLPIGSAWIDDFLLVKNGREVHELLKDAGPARVRGVFFGHVHRGLQIYEDGILYSSVSSPACQFTAGPDDKELLFVPDVPVCFNHLTFTESGTQVKEYLLK